MDDRGPPPPGETDGSGSAQARLRGVAAVLARHGFQTIVARLGLSGPASTAPDRAGPDALAACLVELGPVAIKLGQLLATRSDLLSPEWVAALSALHDRAPPLPFERIEPVLDAAFGGPVDARFARFERTPLAAASIAQVHAAVLADGRAVVVKVRRPGIAAAIDSDLALLRRLARLAEARIPDLARYQPRAIVDQFAASLTRELDLSAEARAAADLAPFLATMAVDVPAFEWEWTCRHVNVQQRMTGIPATDPAAARVAGVDLAGAARRYARAVVRMVLVHGRFHADPHPGNVFFDPPDRVAFIDFGAVESLGADRRDQLVRLVLAIARDDPRAVAAQLLAWAGDPPADREALTAAIAALIEANRARPLAEIDLAQMFGAIFALLRQFRLALPPDLALMLRALLIAEGFVRRLDPAFDIAGEIGPVARELLGARLAPGRLRHTARAGLAALAGAGAAVPDLIGAVERMARTGRLPVSVEAGGSADLAAVIARAARGIALAIVGAGVMVAGSAAGGPAGWGMAAVGAGLGLAAVLRRYQA